jgi:hypothetical protein
VQRLFIIAAAFAILTVHPFAQTPKLKETKIRGYVTEVRSSTDFDIEDYRISRDAGLTLDFENASPDVAFALEDIRVGIELEIKGLLNEQTGELNAKAIKVDLEQFKPLKQTAFVAEGLDGITPTTDGGWIGELKADGQTIQITQNTKVVFKPTSREKKAAKQRAKNGGSAESEYEPLKSLDQVAVGMAMTYEGVRNRDTGKILANRIEFSSNVVEDFRQGSERPELRRTENRSHRQVQARCRQRCPGLCRFGRPAADPCLPSGYERE